MTDRSAQATSDSIHTPLVAALIATLALLVSSTAFSQPASAPPLTANTYMPITSEERIDWIVDGTIGRESLGDRRPAGDHMADRIQYARGVGPGWSGIAKRYAERVADVAISNTIEARPRRAVG